MRISRLEVFVCPVNRRGDWIFLHVVSDSERKGLGEASHGRGFTRASGEDNEAIARALGEAFELVRGERVGDARRALRERGRRRAIAGGLTTMTAYSALEQALCDLEGQVEGVPIHELFGERVREAVAVYANINRATEDRSPEGFARNARRAVEDGFRAVKAAVFDDLPVFPEGGAERPRLIELGARRLRAMREAIGDDVALLVDCHGRFSVDEAIATAARLEPLDLYWFEEPVDPVDAAAARRIREAIRQPTAGGEILFGVEGFAPLLELRAADFIMPDVKHCGGVFEAVEIGRAAERSGVKVSPHNPSGPVSMAASAHAAAVLANCPILEHAWGEVDWRAELLDPPERFEDGLLRVGRRPGLGFSLAAGAPERLLGLER